jgi:hypothetical protein
VHGRGFHTSLFERSRYGTPVSGRAKALRPRSDPGSRPQHTDDVHKDPLAGLCTSGGTLLVSNRHAQRVIVSAVTFVLAQVGCARHYLPPTDWVGPTLASVVEENLRPIVGFDDALEVGQERS